MLFAAEVSRLSLGVLNGFEELLAELWPLRQVFVFTCTSDVLELEVETPGDGEGSTLNRVFSLGEKE